MVLLLNKDAAYIFLIRSDTIYFCHPNVSTIVARTSNIIAVAQTFKLCRQMVISKNVAQTSVAQTFCRQDVCRPLTFLLKYMLSSRLAELLYEIKLLRPLFSNVFKYDVIITSPAATTIYF